MKNIIAPLFLSLIITLGSCKKENTEESVEKQETITTDKAPETTAAMQTPEELGKELFNGKGACVACHQVNEKIVGPSLQNIAKIYVEKNADMVAFLKGNGKAIVDPSQYEIMKASLAITKTMTDEELKALEAYVYSTLN